LIIPPIRKIIKIIIFFFGFKNVKNSNFRLLLSFKTFFYMDFFIWQPFHLTLPKIFYCQNIKSNLPNSIFYRNKEIQYLILIMCKMITRLIICCQNKKLKILEKDRIALLHYYITISLNQFNSFQGSWKYIVIIVELKIKIKQLYTFFIGVFMFKNCLKK